MAPREFNLAGPLTLLVVASFYAALLLVGDLSVRSALGDWVLMLAAGLGAAASVATWRSTRERAWLAIAGYCGFWGAGQAIWTYEELVAHSDPLFPSFADIGYLGAAVSGLVASMLLPRRSGRRAWIELLDGTAVALSLAIVTWALIGSSVPPVTDPRTISLAFIYPAADVAVLTAMVTAMQSATPRWRPYLLAVVAGFSALTVADVGFAVLTATGDYTTGHPIDLGWTGGFLLIAAGARRARVRPGTAPDAPDTADARWPALLLPYLFVAPAATAVLCVAVARGTIGGVFVYLGLALVPVLAIRNGLTIIESERRATALEREMTFDSLTGLWNRRSVGGQVARLSGSDQAFAVIVVDVDGLKDINDSLGHGAGDTILRTVAARIQRSVRRGDTVARIGGDEFAIVLVDTRGIDDALRFVERLFHALAEPFAVEGTVRQISVSAGIAVGVGVESATIDDAGFAMHSAKRVGKGRYEVYEPGLRADALERIELTLDLGRALARDEFVLHYQPAIRLDDDSVVGAEALIRWHHPTRGLLSPNEFIPLLEATPHVEHVGQWVLEEACRFTAELMRAGLVGEGFHMSVNVSPRQLYSGSFVASVERASADAGITPRALVLELTESSFIDIDEAVPILSELRALGVRLAVDDFGTGYSSLSYLHRLPVDILKIDRSFVSLVDRDNEVRALTGAIIAIARALRLRTVGEGVERTSQLEVLRAHGCSAAQGYLWSPPLPAASFTALLTTPSLALQRANTA